jgi:plastocyanin
MLRPFPTLALALASTALALAGCGGGGSSTSSGSGSTSGGATSTPAGGNGGGSGGAAAGPVAVAMKNIAFVPTSVRVKVGQKITWTNNDSVAHNVTATSGASFRSSDFSQGGSFSYTPTKAGTISYVCTLHPGMNGTIVVTR